MPIERTAPVPPEGDLPAPRQRPRDATSRRVNGARRAWQGIDPRRREQFYQQWLDQNQGRSQGRRRQRLPGQRRRIPQPPPELMPSPVPTPQPERRESMNTNPTFSMPGRMDQLPPILQAKRLWESLSYEQQNYVERWVQPRFGSLLDTLQDERSGVTMVNIFNTEIIPRLRDQNMLRGWQRPQ